MKLRHPLFILIEGIDGSGKTTLRNALAAALAAAGNDVLPLSEPTSGPHGRMIREKLGGSEPLSPQEMLELFILDREDDCRENILPALSAGKIVVMDRYYYSNAAYQGAMGIEPQEILRRNREKNFPEPDIIFLVDIDPALSLERVKKRGDAAEQFEKIHFLEKVRSIYRSIIDSTAVILDGTRAPDLLAAEAAEILQRKFYA